ncbi:MAG: DNA-3-methyladenine glycosylase [Planctomycetes bacterium]|nr:DNA-3-methyladenine glycosylase [Planctomycetota bacterium]
MTSILSQSFYARDSLEVAPELVGALVRRDEVLLRITEVEAYRWPDDTACHACKGQTPRNATMFGPPGHAYVYLCYGIHWMLNFVTNRVGEGAAVLIRSAELIEGQEVVACRRGGKSGPVLLTGPGKLGQALQLTRAQDGTPLFGGGAIEVFKGERPAKLLYGPRVGIDNAHWKHVKAPWRFALADSEWVTHRKGLRRYVA